MNYPPVPEVVKFIQPLSQCTIEDLTNNSAIVYGRVKLYHRPHQTDWRWSEFAWWKGAWIDGKGPPSEQCRLRIYCGPDFFTYYGDAEITFFIRLPPEPTSGWHKSKSGLCRLIAFVKLAYCTTKRASIRFKRQPTKEEK